MAAPLKPRLRVPATATPGEVIQIKAMLPHRMETGRRRDDRGGLIPRNVVHSFTCTYNGVEVFRADMNPGISANPFFAFHTVATESGTLTFTWIDEHGDTVTADAQIEVL